MRLRYINLKSVKNAKLCKMSIPKVKMAVLKNLFIFGKKYVPQSVCLTVVKISIKQKNMQAAVHCEFYI